MPSGAYRIYYTVDINQDVGTLEHEPTGSLAPIVEWHLSMLSQFSLRCRL
jgi:hypothetical protein